MKLLFFAHFKTAESRINSELLLTESVVIFYIKIFDLTVHFFTFYKIIFNVLNNTKHCCMIALLY